MRREGTGLRPQDLDKGNEPVIDPDQLYTALLWLIIGVSAVSFPCLFFFTAPYGRHKGKGSGPGMNATLGWLIMELPPPIVFALVYWHGENRDELVPLILLAIWEAHYFYRSFVFPLLLSVRGKQKPIMAVVVGFLFNVINAFLNAYAITNLAPHLSESWLADPRFWLGSISMGVGFAICFHSDRVLRLLRKPGETGYEIPRGGFYRWVSSPNYLGEIIEWGGWAMITWTTAGLSFFLFSFANLFPRAFSHHRWYRETFEDYPEDRKAILPRLL